LLSFKHSVEKALSLDPEHLSIYSLTVEDGTPLQKMLAEEWVPPIDEDVCADMYEWVMAYLPDHGFSQYEVSNWARNEALQSRHNLQYWHYRPYVGFGAGAHSYYGHTRWANVLAIPDYIQKMNVPDNLESHRPRRLRTIFL
jgi:oxygen-independent coproporphyrinogen-3 oxidase